QAALETAQRTVRAEEDRIRPADTSMCRPVVAREDDDRVLVQLQLAQKVENAADAAIQARHHRGVGGAGMRMRQVALATLVRRIVPQALVLLQRILRHLEGDVRDGERKIQEEGPVLVVPNELQRLRLELIVRMVLAR